VYIYFGSDNFALEVLQGLFEEVPPLAVVTQPDRARGRKQKIQLGPLSAFAQKHQLPLIQPENLKSTEVQDEILNYGAKLLIVVSFGQLIPQSFLDRCPSIINAHASNLPKYRGASPIQSVIINGESETAMTIMHIELKLDAGPMISKEEIVLEDRETHQSLSSKLSNSAIKLLMPYAKGEPVPAGEVQDHKYSSHCKKFEKADLELKPKLQTSEMMDRLTRAFYPKPGCFLQLKLEESVFRLKVIEMHPVENQAIPLSSLCEQDGHLFLRGISGPSLQLDVVQPEGKPAMPTQSFLNGWKKSFELI
jgi:methionyl-tRNA formyltransferase